MLLAVWVLEEGNATRGQMVFARFNDDIPALLFRLPTQRLLLRQVGICCGFTMDSVRDSVWKGGLVVQGHISNNMCSFNEYWNRQQFG